MQLEEAEVEVVAGHLLVGQVLEVVVVQAAVLVVPQVQLDLEVLVMLVVILPLKVILEDPTFQSDNIKPAEVVVLELLENLEETGLLPTMVPVMAVMG